VKARTEKTENSPECRSASFSAILLRRAAGGGKEFGRKARGKKPQVQIIPFLTSRNFFPKVNQAVENQKRKKQRK